MEMIESYNQKELADLEKMRRQKIAEDNENYIRIKVRTAQSRTTARWYSIRYIRKKDLTRYLLETNWKEKNKKAK